MQVTRNENHTPTSFHASIVAMEQGLVEVADVADDFVHCTQCGACELRCPNTLLTGDFYRHRTRTVDVVKAMRALMVETGNEREGWKLWNERLAPGPQRAGARRDARGAGARRRLGDRARHPRRRRDDPVRRLRGRVLPPELHARVRAVAPAGRRRVRADARAMVLRRPGGGDGLRRPGAQARDAQRRRLARGRRQADPGAGPARLHRVHRGLPEVLRRRLRLRDRARRRADQRPRQGRKDRAHHAGRAHRHLPRPMPAQQAQGRPRGTARAAQRDPGHHVPRRQPRHTVVLLQRRRWRSADREARDHRGDQPPPGGAGEGASTTPSTRSSARARGRSAR